MDNKNLFYFRTRVDCTEELEEGLVCAVDELHARSIIEDVYGDMDYYIEEISPLQYELGGVLWFPLGT